MSDQSGVFAGVKVEGESRPVLVSISNNKPIIPISVLGKWQKIVDLIARIMLVPSGLITRLTEKDLEIVVASQTKGNPYKRDDHDRLGIGMFCETVAGRRRELRVDDSATSDFWIDNPHAGLGMKSYMGVPIEWEDGELFGTFCILNSEANAFHDDYLELMRQFKEIIETDLRCILLQSELEDRLSAKELELREIHHRLKNQLNILISYISIQGQFNHDSVTRELLKEVQHRVLAVSMIHESLSNSAQVIAPTLDGYLSRLCDYILEDLGDGSIVAEYDIGKLILPMERQITLALILSELITNSIKHAFSGDGPKHIKIEARRLSDGRLCLDYHDNGTGLPDSFDLATGETLGMLIIRSLVNQLGGTMRAENEGGAAFKFLFDI